MFESITLVSVVGCTLLMLAVYTLWYAFFPPKTQPTYGEFAELLLASAALFPMVVIIAFVMDLCDRAGVTLLHLALFFTLFSCGLLCAFAIKEGKDVRSYLIHAGFATLFCCGSIAILHFWPW